MNKKQIFSLIVGLLFLAGGIFFLARMSQVDNPNSLEELFDFSEETTVAAQEEQNVSEEEKTALSSQEAEVPEEEEKSGLTRMIEWIVSKDIPIWGYLVVMVAVILGVRGYGIYREYKAYKEANIK